MRWRSNSILIAAAAAATAFCMIGVIDAGQDYYRPRKDPFAVARQYNQYANDRQVFDLDEETQGAIAVAALIIGGIAAGVVAGYLAALDRDNIRRSLDSSCSGLRAFTTVSKPAALTPTVPVGANGAYLTAASAYARNLVGSLNQFSGSCGNV